MILRTLLAFFLVIAVLALTVSASPSVSSDVHTFQTRARAGKKPSYVAEPAENLECEPFGECEPCPEDDLKQPFCMPFGNRRLLHCVPRGAGADAHKIPAWEACGKVVKQEKHDFYSFITSNLLLLIVCLVIYGVRTSTLAAQQYRQLAARIGIPSGAFQV
ncbi:uncharacterized protein EHS24_005090 [Apiotrichum porosum]|uniref:Uncharacterized protein n=1 Tax=Apiotrichum porosum TaxID=105984 RepID=A0A427Y6Y2_9TREE|nr:uncharacterized protein EHS24_005090 [Apiotrichum porosum]RSH86816.1 hypothetical protein EHS24_005090 [Apiotrichum porosum]